MNITYLLAAGASAEAIPTVKDSNKSFAAFSFYLHQIVSEGQLQYSAEDQLHFWSMLKDYEMIIAKARMHLSYDTFAKKLWLLNDITNFKRLKEFISLFCFYKSFNFYKLTIANVAGLVTDENVYDEQLFLPWQESSLFGNHTELNRDKRYDAFVAGLCNEIKEGLIMFPNNISIVSWNYDLQLEIVFETYNKEGKNLTYMYNPLQKNADCDPAFFGTQIIKLNGVASYCMDDCDNGFPTTDSTIYRNTSILKQPNQELFDLFVFFVKNRDNGASWPYINFAWEKNIVSISAITNAKNIFKKTECLVVIGYSFPLFNREVDKELLVDLKLADNSKIYIQTVSENEFNQIKTRLTGLIHIDEERIVYIKDVDQFYVPFEINSEPWWSGGLSL